MVTGSGFVSYEGAEVQVEINGEAARLLSVSPSHIAFECPDVPQGTVLRLAVNQGAQRSNSVTTTVHEVSPGIFTTDGEGGSAGTILLNNSLELVSGPDEKQGKPARQGDALSILATGLGRTFGSGANQLGNALTVLVDGLPAEILSARSIGSGVYQIDARIPDSVRDSEAVPVQLQVSESNGRTKQSNAVKISVGRDQTVIRGQSE
jgi:uncharacterized protein (TIGR03437 family)